MHKDSKEAQVSTEQALQAVQNEKGVSRARDTQLSRMNQENQQSITCTTIQACKKP